ncbi:MAG: hypothetical protein ACOC9D_06815 [Thermodesulfobacteriota bacterium]
MKSRSTRYACLLLFVLFSLWLLQGKGTAQNATVVFECEDIGVEARRVLSNLKEERRRFEKQKQHLDRRENELKILQQEVDKKLKRLTELQEE